MNSNIFYQERNIRQNGIAVTNPMPDFECMGNRIGKLTGFHMLNNTIVDDLRTISFSEEDMACGILFLGNAGCGKTNVIYRLMYDALTSMTEEDVAIVYDVKREFTEQFRIKGDVVLAPDSYSDVWNIYNDILAFAVSSEERKFSVEQVRMRSLEIASRLFEGQRSDMNPFFVNAAVQTVAGIIELNILEAITTSDGTRWLNNRKLREELGRMGQEDYYERFANAGSRFTAHAKFFTENKDSEGKGIVTEIITMVNKQFIGAFGEAGEFSIADFVEKRGGRTVFVQNDISLGNTLAPILTAFFDMAICYAARPGKPRGKIFVFLDEIATLHMRQLEMALTLLRSQRVCIVGGLQNVSRQRMNEPNNPAKTDALLESFQNVIAMDCMVDTQEYLKKRFGKTQVMERYDAPNGRLELRPRERSVVEDYDFADLRCGDAFCKIRGHAVFKYHFDKYVF